MTAAYDAEMWLAAHDDCPYPGCGTCVILDIEWDEALLNKCRLAASILKEPLDVFMYKAVREGLNAVRSRLGPREICLDPV